MVKQELLVVLPLINGNVNCMLTSSFVTIYSLTLLLSNDQLIRPNGVRFHATAGSSEFAKRWNPQTGDIITFKHHGYLFTSKKPKFPTLHRLRNDLQWEDVVHQWKEPNPILKG